MTRDERLRDIEGDGNADWRLRELAAAIDNLRRSVDDGSKRIVEAIANLEMALNERLSSR
jgi:hypothetical protein